LPLPFFFFFLVSPCVFVFFIFTEVSPLPAILPQSYCLFSLLVSFPRNLLLLQLTLPLTGKSLLIDFLAARKVPFFHPDSVARPLPKTSTALSSLSSSRAPSYLLHYRRSPSIKYGAPSPPILDPAAFFLPLVLVPPRFLWSTVTALAVFLPPPTNTAFHESPVSPSLPMFFLFLFPPANGK